MPNVLTTFSFANVSFLINGSPVQGYWEGDDAIVIERNKPEGNAVVGVDGCAVVSRSADKSVSITLKVSPTCTAHQVLNQLRKQIDDGLTTTFSVSITDTGNGEGGASDQATIIEAPDSTFGENAGEREWVIFANGWANNSIDYTLG